MGACAQSWPSEWSIMKSQYGCEMRGSIDWRLWSSASANAGWLRRRRRERPTARNERATGVDTVSVSNSNEPTTRESAVCCAPQSRARAAPSEHISTNDGRQHAPRPPGVSRRSRRIGPRERTPLLPRDLEPRATNTDPAPPPRTPRHHSVLDVALAVARGHARASLRGAPPRHCGAPPHHRICAPPHCHSCAPPHRKRSSATTVLYHFLIDLVRKTRLLWKQ